MSQYLRLEYGMKDARTVGRRLAGTVYFDRANHAEAVEIFSVADSRRDSHILPMRSVHASVRSHMRQPPSRGTWP